jgi:hypothetical protein
MVTSLAFTTPLLGQLVQPGKATVAASWSALVRLRPSSNASPWLILSAVATNTTGPGIFGRTTYIQRVNTIGGLAPAGAPTQLGQEARVPYTAEYFFYREANR